MVEYDVVQLKTLSMQNDKGSFTIGLNPERSCLSKDKKQPRNHTSVSR